MNIIKQTVLNVCDNSGAKLARCIGLYKNKKSANISDIILVSVIKLNKKIKNHNITKGKKFKAIIIRTKSHIQRGPHTFKCLDNAIVLLNDNMKLVGSRISGSTIRSKDQISDNYKKILSLSNNSF